MYNHAFYFKKFQEAKMSDTTLILLSAGSSTRLNLGVKKQWLRLGETPLWLFVACNLANMAEFERVLIVANESEIFYMQRFLDDLKFKEQNSLNLKPKFELIAGGDERAISLKNALKIVKSEFVMVSDVARAGISKILVQRLLEARDKFDCVSPFLGVCDSAYLGEKMINRDELKLIQTPQISRTNLLKKALDLGENFLDDSSAVAFVGGKIGFVEGEKEAFKITRKSDLTTLKSLNFPSPSKEIYTGNGYDVHKFCTGDGIKLCGVKVPCEYKFIAHSDGDVGLHALCDAILGAAGLGDIGEFFPDSDEKFRGIDSEILLSKVLKMVRNFGFKLINIDVTIIAQAPKISPFKEQMAQNLARICEISRTKINIKATTTEGLGFTGRKEGIAVIATANLGLFDWEKVE